MSEPQLLSFGGTPEPWALNLSGDTIPDITIVRIRRDFHLVLDVFKLSRLDWHKSSTPREWHEIAPLVPSDVRSMANKFVELCHKYYAFDCSVECVIDLVDEDSIIFDWNDGTEPMLTVVIVPGPRAIYVSNSKGGVEKDEVDALDILEGVLKRFVNICGRRQWHIDVSQDLLTKKQKKT